MFSIDEIKNITKGKYLNESQGTSRIKGVSIDSRTTKNNYLFLAIKGHRLDGHRFIGDAIKKGARVILVSKNVSSQKGITIIKVKDTTLALGQLASFHRDRFDIPVIAVTGSCGKTTTKEMIAAVLETKYRVLKNPMTHNNQYGVPLSLLKLKKIHQIAILELGTNAPGEISYLAGLTKPTVAVFTNIGESHLQGLKNIAGVFKEKIQLIKHLKGCGHIIYNGDDPSLKRIKNLRIPHKRISYSLIEKSDFVATKIKRLSPKKFQFHSNHLGFQINTCLKPQNVWPLLLPSSFE